MYFYYNGIITMRFKDRIVVECQGVGYEVIVAHPELFELGSQRIVYVSFYTREDEQYLVGFSTLEERTIFMKLISVRGIGPKTAISALGGTTPSSLVQAIDANNIIFLKKLPGIGPKAAAQIILDLRGKLSYSSTSQTGNKELDDALSALKQFGFKSNEILDVLNTINQADLKAEEYILIALKKLRKVSYE